ncbi:hypothetical protein DBV15_10186 [Temnothorax longispinosus]|uniref:Uncharacterized protein n=1 Tax=Temnothorax longispinosus TaxID=300112 RepID=A0A4S2KUS5_9HYME|nr:hypothetical protein DBV15_10186 [Temnothorax longispinosus]
MLSFSLIDQTQSRTSRERSTALCGRHPDASDLQNRMPTHTQQELEFFSYHRWRNLEKRRSRSDRNQLKTEPLTKAFQGKVEMVGILIDLVDIHRFRGIAVGGTSCIVHTSGA